MLCGDGLMEQLYPGIWASTADYFENIHLHSIKQPHCALCKALKSLFAERNSLSWQLREYRRYFQRIIFSTQGHEMKNREVRQYLEDRAVRTPEGVFWNKKCISPTTIFIPDYLHTISLGILNHLMHWVKFLLEQHLWMEKLNQIWTLMPPYPGFAPVNKPYSQVTHWSGIVMKALRSMSVSVFAATRLNPSARQSISFTEAL